MDEKIQHFSFLIKQLRKKCVTVVCLRVCVWPWGEAASPFCLGLKGEGGSAAVRGLLSLVSSTPLSLSASPLAGGTSPLTGAWGQRRSEGDLLTFTENLLIIFICWLIEVINERRSIKAKMWSENSMRWKVIWGEKWLLLARHISEGNIESACFCYKD